jgi:hypothetical protein
MLFKGRELKIGDKLISKRHGEITVSDMSERYFTARLADGSGRQWEYKGRDAYDVTWPEAPQGEDK